MSQVAAGKGGVELGVQFARTDAALDATLSALLRRADTKKGVYDLSPKRSAVLVERAFEVQMRRELLIEGVPASKGLHTFEEHRCRSRGCRRLKKLLVASREAKKNNASDIFEFYSLLNRNLLVIARDAAVEVLRAPVRGSQLAPSLYASVHLLASISYVIVVSERARGETCGFLAWRSPTAREGTASWIARWKNRAALRGGWARRPGRGP